MMNRFHPCSILALVLVLVCGLRKCGVSLSGLRKLRKPRCGVVDALDVVLEYRLPGSNPQGNVPRMGFQTAVPKATANRIWERREPKLQSRRYLR